MKYTSAQNLFKYYAKKFKEDVLLQEEFLDAINKILNLYDTKIYENRFIVGGVIEFIVLATFRALEFDASHVGKISQRFDLKIKYKNEDIFYSVKSIFTKSSEIRLINVLGKSSQTHWEEPTIFLLPKLGIGYCDNTLIDKKFIIRKEDVIVINKKTLENFLKNNSEFLISLNLPYKNEIKPETAHLASEDVAVSLLKNYKRLKL
jgi:hypothetical protein